MGLKYDHLYSEAEARIWKEKKRLHEESLHPPSYETEEFIIPDEPPWPKKNPYIKETYTNDQGTAAQLPKN